MEKLDWMKEVNWKEGLTEDLRMVLSVCGEDVLLALLERLPGHRIHVSTIPLRKAQRMYVRKFAGRKSAREIAVQIGASLSFVQKTLSEMEKDNQD